jgi:hypothetical protein
MSEGEGHTPSTSLISICEKSSSQSKAFYYQGVSNQIVVLWYKKQYHDKQLFSPDTIQLQDLLDYHSYPCQISDVMLIAEGLCTLCIQLGSLHIIIVAMKTSNDMAT